MTSSPSNSLTARSAVAASKETKEITRQLRSEVQFAVRMSHCRVDTVHLPLKSMWPNPLCLPVSLSMASLTVGDSGR